MDHCSSLPTSNIQSSIEVFRFYTFALLSSAETFKLDALKMKLLKTDIRNLVVDVTKFCEENKLREQNLFIKMHIDVDEKIKDLIQKMVLIKP